MKQTLKDTHQTPETPHVEVFVHMFIRIQIRIGLTSLIHSVSGMVSKVHISKLQKYEIGLREILEYY